MYDKKAESIAKHFAYHAQINHKDQSARLWLAVAEAFSENRQIPHDYLLDALSEAACHIETFKNLARCWQYMPNKPKLFRSLYDDSQHMVDVLLKMKDDQSHAKTLI